MTLYRQLIALTLSLFLLLFGGTWLLEVRTIRTFLSAQLQSHAQDTATSLGLTLSGAMDAADRAQVRTVLNAVFDRGYYEAIVVEDLDGELVASRRTEVRVEGVPAWFLRLVALEAPSATAQVLSGWRLQGRVTVRSHPGYLYQTLWQSSLRTGSWFLGIFALALVLETLGMSLLLRPLQGVEEQAEAICDRRFLQQQALPRTRELRRVVTAMNKMTATLKRMFEEQADLAERLRQQSYQDPLTGLANRRFLEAQAESFLDRGRDTVRGGFLLVQVANLQQLNERCGFEEAEELLKRTAHLLDTATVQFSERCLARITGSEFALLLPDLDETDLQILATTVTAGLASLGHCREMELGGHVGGLRYEGATELADLLRQADDALRQARETGLNRFVLLTHRRGGPQAVDRSRLAALLEHRLQQGNVACFGQRVFARTDPDQILQLEVFARLRQDDGHYLPSGSFIVLAEERGLVHQLDRLMTSRVLALARHLDTPLVALNLSLASLLDRAFQQWFLEVVREAGADRDDLPRLAVELNERHLLHYGARLKAYLDTLRRQGVLLGIDHVGQGGGHFGYLATLRPEYIKIDRSFSSGLLANRQETRFFLASLASAAHSLDIAVIAEGIEKEEQLRLCEEIHVEGVQGYLLDRPALLAPEGSA